MYLSTFLKPQTNILPLSPNSINFSVALSLLSLSSSFFFFFHLESYFFLSFPGGWLFHLFHSFTPIIPHLAAKFFFFFFPATSKTFLSFSFSPQVIKLIQTPSKCLLMTSLQLRGSQIASQNSTRTAQRKDAKQGRCLPKIKLPRTNLMNQ